MSHAQSLIPPFSNGFMNYWLFHGATINKTISLTGATTCSRSSIWNKVLNTATSWKLELKYTAFNPTGEFVADGLALWYMPISVEETYQSKQFAYGGPFTNFTGLLIAIDTFKQKNGQTLPRTAQQSSVIVVHNKIPRVYDWETEGHAIKSGRCLVTNRYYGTDKTVSTVALEYVDNVLRVYHTNNSNVLEWCLTVRGINLPLGYSFGISAASGGYSGQFEVRHFKFHPEARSFNGQPLAVIDAVKDYHDPNNVTQNDSFPFHIIYALLGFIIFIIILLIILVVFLFKNRNQSSGNVEEKSGPKVMETGNSLRTVQSDRAPVNTGKSNIVLPKVSFTHRLTPVSNNDDYANYGNYEDMSYDHLNFSQ